MANDQQRLIAAESLAQRLDRPMGVLGVVPREVVNTRGDKKTSGKDGVYHNTHRTGGLHVPP